MAVPTTDGGLGIAPTSVHGREGWVGHGG